jgi:hypothetical protein
MLFSTFYTSYTLQQSIPSTAPQTLDRDQLALLLRDGLGGEDDFVGIVDQAGRVLQFLCGEPGHYIAEIPQIDAQQSLQRILPESELSEFIATLPSNLANLDLALFSLQSWPLE